MNRSMHMAMCMCGAMGMCGMRMYRGTESGGSTGS